MTADLSAATPTAAARVAAPCEAGHGIREVSQMTSLSVDTLRWYERQGLLPVVARTTSGRRRYSDDAVQFVRLVQALRRTGMSICDVRQFVQPRAEREDSHRQRMDLLVHQRALVHQQIDQVAQSLSLIDAKIDDLSALIASGGDCEDVYTLAPAAGG